MSRDAGQQPAASGPAAAAKVLAGRGDRAALPGVEASLAPPRLEALFPLLMLQASPVESIDTYAVIGGVCTSTHKDTFNLGEQVCARVDNSPLRAAAALRRVSISGTDGTVASVVDVTSNPQTLLLTLPSSATSVVDGETVDNRGTWSAAINSAEDNGVRAIAYFSVADPSAAAADLAIYAVSTSTDTLAPGQSTGFFVYLNNIGPNEAQDVHVTQSVPPNMTFVSATAGTGTAFTCSTTGSVVDCAPAQSLAKGAISTFTLNYTVNQGAPNSLVSTDIDINGATTDPRPASNSSTVKIEIRTAGTAAATCSLDCPPDITVTADTTQNSVLGAVVNFAGGISSSGDCGPITTSPASGSFFPVGTTIVSVSSATGGGSCSFAVTVLDTAPPTITCNANIGVTAPAGSCDATVAVVAPATTGSGVTVTSTRSDGEAIDAPYPGGITTITWTATDSDGRKASCTQTVTVTTNDTIAPTITAPPDVSIATPPGTSGSCGLVVGETELGTPTTDDNCSASVTVTRTGVPSGGFFPVGTTTVTYTAKDGAGNTATAVQHVTVTDGTPPLIAAPPDATYTCPGEVPAASASQATSGTILDSNGNPLPPAPPSDNCGTPTVTVSETRSGAGSAASPLIISRVFTATDTAGNSASSTQTITVTDSTPPTISAPPDVSVNTGPGATSCDVVVSNAVLGSAIANDNCVVTVSRSPSGNVFPVGTTDVVWTATDSGGNTATATQHVTVVDNTAPVVTPPAAVTLFTGSGATSCSVTISNLDATLGTGSATDNCAGLGAVTRSGVPSGGIFPIGTTTLTYSATDGHGNTGTATQTVTVVDNTPPTIVTPSNVTAILPANTTVQSMVVNYPAATATDNCAGTVTVSSSPASGSTFNVGTTTVTVTATDAHNNSATATFTVTVLYPFTGFFSPVINLPTLNAVNAGRAIPVKFSLSGNRGLNIFAANSPSSGPFACGSTDPATDLTETLTAGSSSLTYDTNQYIYVWKTDSAWAGTCRQLVLSLNDGSVYRANFKFK
ncbi:MAG: HYR domain-containing protein [Pyrinomonadaceae bacterium]